MISSTMREYRRASRRRGFRPVLFFVTAAFLANAAAEGSGSRKYGDYIRSAADRHGLDENLIHSIIEAESNYNPSAVSVKGAVGLMQLIPETASRYGVADIFDPAQNIDAGVRYLKDLFSLYRSDLRSVLAAYNAGPEAVKKHNGIPPYPETERYVRKVLRIYNRRGGETGGRVYAFRDERGKVLLTSDRFYLSLRREAAPER
jgi:soluble lytic murein transglycosylase-like protein